MIWEKLLIKIVEIAFQLREGGYQYIAFKRGMFALIPKALLNE